MMRNKIFLLKIFIMSVILASCSQNKYQPDYILTSIDSFQNSYVFGCGDNGLIAFSKDLNSWEYHIIDKDITFYDVTYLKDNIIALGKRTSSDKSLLCCFNPDTKKWTVTEYEDHIRQIELVNNQLFIFLHDSIKISDEGSQWKNISFPFYTTARNDIKNIPECILYDGKNYIMAGEGNFIATSQDLRDWSFKAENNRGTGSLLGLASNGKKNVVVGDKIYIASSDINTNTWLVQENGQGIEGIESISDYYTLCLYDVASNGQKFVAVGARGLILNSEDGAEWTIVKTSEKSLLGKIIWNGKVFICLGDNGLLISPDGENWTDIP